MTINFQAFVDVLPILGKGMLGIFIVTGIIILSIIVLNASTHDKAKN
ncbi:MAG: hypothetical protein RR051_00235 [Clostridiales bacterium]